VNGTDAVNVNQLKELESNAFSGIAATAAMTFTMRPSAPGKTTVTLNGANFRDKNAAGLNVAHWLNVGANPAAHPVVINAAVGFGSGEEVYRVGAGFEF
jgi:hypothetical protein